MFSPLAQTRIHQHAEAIAPSLTDNDLCMEDPEAYHGAVADAMNDYQPDILEVMEAIDRGGPVDPYPASMGGMDDNARCNVELTYAQLRTLRASLRAIRENVDDLLDTRRDELAQTLAERACA